MHNKIILITTNNGIRAPGLKALNEARGKLTREWQDLKIKL